MTAYLNGKEVIDAESVLIRGVNGIDVNPGSDIDADLVTVGVTGAPKLWWDESEDAFVSSKEFQIAAGNLFHNGSLVCINDTANANMTIGATFNQGPNDDEIVALKSSDVAHAMTGIAEADTFGVFQKTAAGSGGLNIRGFKSAAGNAYQALSLMGMLGEAATTTKAAGHAVVEVDAYVVSGSSITGVAADGNLFGICNGGTAKLIFDAEGTMHQITGDNDLDLLCLSGTTGTPKLWWDESEDKFAINKGLDAVGILRSTGVTIDQTGNAVFTIQSTGAYNYVFTLDSADNYKLKVSGYVGNILTLDGITGGVFINDTANANTTMGLTVQQSTNDNHIVTLKSATDVAHAITTGYELDDFGVFKKAEAAAGGLMMVGLKSSAGVAGHAVQIQGILDETAADTTKSAAGIGVVTIDGCLEGTNVAAVCGANENLLAVRNLTTTCFIVDAEGDLFANSGTTTAAVTVYDEHDDAELLRAYALAIGKDRGVVDREHDKWLKYNEAHLVELGILGDTIENGGLTCITKLQKLLVGYANQAEDKMRQMGEKLERYEQALLDMGASPALLTA